MSTETIQHTILKGGEWLIRESDPQQTFIPEDYSEEQQMVKDMCIQFIQSEVLPVVDRLDKLEEDLLALRSDGAAAAARGDTAGILSELRALRLHINNNKQ